MNPVAKRTITGITTGLLVIGLFLYCPLRAILPIILMLSSFLQLEFYNLAKKSEPVVWLGLVFGCLWVLFAGIFGFQVGLLAVPAWFGVLLAVAGAIVSLFVLFNSRRSDPVASIASTLFGILYIPFLLSFFLLLVQTTGNGYFVPADAHVAWDGADPQRWTRTGLYTLLALVATAKFSDTGGFAFGLAFGKHKLCPTISPKKSWEGLLGSVVFAAVTMCVFYMLSLKFDWAGDIKAWQYLSYPTAAALGAVLAIVATLGDLVESRFKRAAGVKDSSSFMPAGIGGFLDMFDSLLFLPVLVYPVVVALSVDL